MTRIDKEISLYGHYSALGRMTDLHFPKSCVDFEWDDLGNIDPADPNAVMVNIKPEA